jgi:hypothetical protein
MKKGPRSWNRRDFNVAANGYFTILKPAGWFPTVRLPQGFRYPTVQPKVNASQSEPRQKPLDHVYGQGLAMPYAITRLSEYHPGLIRSSLIVFAAGALTSILLWWIMHP